MGLTWERLGDEGNGTAAVMIIFAVEWVVFMVLAWCVGGRSKVLLHLVFCILHMYSLLLV